MAIATICLVSSAMQVRWWIIAVSDEMLWFGVPGAAVALAWLTLWRPPLRRVGNAWDVRPSVTTIRLVTFGIAAFWGAAVLLQLGLRDVLAEWTIVDDAAALRGARPTRFIEMRTFDVDRAACASARDTWSPSKGRRVTVTAAVACPFSSGERDAWFVWSRVEGFDRARFRDADERASIYGDLSLRTELELAGLPSRIKYFERITNGIAGILAPKLPPSATMLHAHVRPYEAGGWGYLLASGALVIVLFCALFVVPIQRPAAEDAAPT